MENFILNYEKFFESLDSDLNEMASTLGKLPVPKKMISAIHRLSAEDVKPFTYSYGERGRSQDWKHGKGAGTGVLSTKYKNLIDTLQDKGKDALSDEEKDLLSDIENKAASLGYNELSRNEKSVLIASKTYKDPGILPHDVDVVDPGVKFPELKDENGVKLLKDENGIPYAKFKKTRLLGNMYDMPRAKQARLGRRKDPGFLANISDTPWGGMRMLLSIPDENRYDYVYYKGRAYYSKDERGGKKYRVVTMDEDGNIIRDWMAYQGKITFPRDVRDEADEELLQRNDFKDFPVGSDGYINVYFLDVEDTSAQEKREKRLEGRKITNRMFVETFKIKFEKILKSILGKRSTAVDKDAILSDLGKKYGNFLKYMKFNGSYEGIMSRGDSEWKELDDVVDGLSGNAEDYASIEDIIAIHSMASALRKFAEYIITNEVDDVYKEMDMAISDFEEFDEGPGEGISKDDTGVIEEPEDLETEDEEEDDEDW